MQSAPLGCRFPISLAVHALHFDALDDWSGQSRVRSNQSWVCHLLIRVCAFIVLVLAQGLVHACERASTQNRLVVDARGFSLSVVAACIRQSSVVCGVPALPVRL